MFISRDTQITCQNLTITPKQIAQAYLLRVNKPRTAAIQSVM